MLCAFPLPTVLQCHQQYPFVNLFSGTHSDCGKDIFNFGQVENQSLNFLHFIVGILQGGSRRGLQMNEETALIRFGDKLSFQIDEDGHAPDKNQCGHEHNDPPMTQTEPQSLPVLAFKPLIAPLKKTGEFAPLLFHLKEPGTEHGDQDQRNDQ